MSRVEWIFRPEVERPVMICAFSGWNDGGEAASTAGRHLRDLWGARRFAGLDPESMTSGEIGQALFHRRALC